MNKEERNKDAQPEKHPQELNPFGKACTGYELQCLADRYGGPRKVWRTAIALQAKDVRSLLALVWQQHQRLAEHRAEVTRLRTVEADRKKAEARAKRVRTGIGSATILGGG